MKLNDLSLIKQLLLLSELSGLPIHPISRHSQGNSVVITPYITSFIIPIGTVDEMVEISETISKTRYVSRESCGYLSFDSAPGRNGVIIRYTEKKQKGETKISVVTRLNMLTGMEFFDQSGADVINKIYTVVAALDSVTEIPPMLIDTLGVLHRSIAKQDEIDEAVIRKMCNDDKVAYMLGRVVWGIQSVDLDNRSSYSLKISDSNELKIARSNNSNLWLKIKPEDRGSDTLQIYKGEMTNNKEKITEVLLGTIKITGPEFNDVVTQISNFILDIVKTEDISQLATQLLFRLTKIMSIDDVNANYDVLF